MAAVPFTVTESDDPGPPRVVVLALAGKLDPPASDALQARTDALVASGVRRFVFDLTDLTYIGSLGLRVLIALHTRVKGDGVVVAANPTPDVRSVFEVTKLTQVIRFYPTRAEAADAARTH